MIIKSQRITIIKMSRPDKDINQELQWFGSSLGLFNLRDKDKSCFRLFVELLNSAKMNLELTSDQLALKTNLSRGTVIHHLNKLMEAGLVVSDRNKYALRVKNLKELISEMERDIQRTCEDLRKVAEDIDQWMHL